MLIEIVLLAVSLLLLMAGAESLVRGATAIARRMGLSSFFIGLTIVGWGTSTPELVTSIDAAYHKLGGISLGNVVGSNIFNIAVILGLSALIAPIAVNTKTVRNEIIVMIAAAFVPFLALFTGGVLTRGMGLAMCAALLIFLVQAYRANRPAAAAEAPIEAELERELGIPPDSFWSRLPLACAAIIAGILLLAGGSRLLVAAAVAIAESLGISSLVIGLTVVAAGTSMPELVTSVIAALRRQADISLGNVIGSNIFNILGIAGITAAIYPQTLGRQLFVLDLPLMAALTVASLPILLTGNRISRAEGAFFLLVYALYMFTLFHFAPKWFE